MQTSVYEVINTPTVPAMPVTVNIVGFIQAKYGI